MAGYKKTLTGSHLGDRLFIKVATKNVYFDALFDDCGSCFKISKKELKEALK